MNTCPDDCTPQQQDELAVAISGYRGTFAAHDFNDLETRRADRELCQYLVGLLMWPRIHRPRQLLLQLPRCRRSQQQEHQTVEAYHALFCHRMTECSQKLAALLPTVGLLVTIGVTMLYLSNLVSSEGSKDDFWHTISEAIRVGGWVATWTAVALFFYDGLRTLYRLWIFWRLSRLPIAFCYERRGTSADKDEAAKDSSASKPELATHA